MKFKNPFKKAILNTTKDHSLEELLLSIEESNTNKENLDLKQYNKNIVNAACNTLLNKTLTLEDKKNISLKNNKKLKKLKTLLNSSKILSYLIPLHFILLITIVIPYMKSTFIEGEKIISKVSFKNIEGIDKYTVKTQILPEVVKGLDNLTINYQIIISFLLFVLFVVSLHGILELCAYLLRRSTLKKTKKEYNLNHVFENIKGSFIKELNLIDNPKLLIIKEEMMNHVNDNKKHLLKNINDSLENNVIGNNILNIDNKLIKKDKDNR